MKRIIGLLLLILLTPCLAFADLTVHFLDVGQGDSAIIICDGEAMIIDGGLPGQSDKIYSVLENEPRARNLIYVVATHPDNDHIGGLPALLQKKDIGVQYIYSPVKEYNSKRFGFILKYANERNLDITVPYDGLEVYLGNDATVTFYNFDTVSENIDQTPDDRSFQLFPRDEPEEIATNNDMSLVVRIVYKDVSFLFTGDIEAAAEQRLINNKDVELQADVLKVAHHGSRGSNTRDFLEKVNPTYAVISCGKNNIYKHPSADTLNTLQSMDIRFFRTDLQGDITFKTDGKNIEFKTKKNAKSEDLNKAPQ